MTKHSAADGQVTERFFWGGHGGVGGSDAREPDCGVLTLRFLLKEMERRNLGLAMDASAMDIDRPINVDARALNLKEEQNPVMKFFNFLTGRHVRDIEKLDEVDEAAVKRYKEVKDWRPDALKRLEEVIEGNSGEEEKADGE